MTRATSGRSASSTKGASERVCEGKRVTMDFWRGPLSVLGDSLEESDIPGVEAQR